MQTFNNVHQQFAEFFKSEILKPYAYLVSKKLSEGHICVHLNEVNKELNEDAFYNAFAMLKNQSKLKEEPFVSTEAGVKQPFILHNNRLYLQRYFNYETSIVTRIEEFIKSEAAEFTLRTNDLQFNKEFIQTLFANELEGESSIATENINWQLAAAIVAVLNNFTIITGGPGTGKTTTVAKILAILFTINPVLKVALAAPTGKAAVRMAESLQSSASQLPDNIKKNFQSISPGTIHRLLKFVPDTPYFRHNPSNPVNYDVVIVDESSMIDVALFAKLLGAIGPATKLILLGDKDQLASVEAGSLFGDLCKTQLSSNMMTTKRAEFINTFIKNAARRITGAHTAEGLNHLLSEHIIELKRSHRFTSDKGIGKFSKAIIKNDLDSLQEYIYQNSDEQVVIDKDYHLEIFERFISGYEDYIREPDTRQALRKINKLRVLCAVRDGAQGLYYVNNLIETYLRKKKLIDKNFEFYKNRPVIITRNYYTLGLYNGDVGIVRPDENGILKVWFEDSDGALKSVLPGYISAAETVFAMTIHKSQGSEYDSVLVVLPNHTNIPILKRELLYTAVTRAKSKVIVQGTEEVILYAANGVVERASGIMERFGE